VKMPKWKFENFESSWNLTPTDFFGIRYGKI